MKFIYNLAMMLMAGGLRLGAIFNSKMRLGLKGRRHIFKRLALAINPDVPVAWFHAASLGEFEQGRPVIEAYGKQFAEHQILLTFFSPSGYQMRKDYHGAHHVFYLPIDTPRNARRFLRIVNPEIAIFIKYEFWLNYLAQLRGHRVKTYIISAIFRPDQIFFKPQGGLAREALDTFATIFVQDNESATLLGGIGYKRVVVAGDTRFDRVCQIAREAKSLPEIERFCEGCRVLIAGSTWPPDEALIMRLIDENRDIKFIVAPHQIDPTRIDKFILSIEGVALRYTQLSAQSDLLSARVLVIDTIGVLSSAYRYGTWAYIGGGFGAGIHNTLEAATFGLPLAFGPNYSKFREARDLIENSGAVSVKNYGELSGWFAEVSSDSASYQARRKACLKYVELKCGATAKIMQQICK